MNRNQAYSCGRIRWLRDSAPPNFQDLSGWSTVCLLGATGGAAICVEGQDYLVGGFNHLEKWKSVGSYYPQYIMESQKETMHGSKPPTNQLLSFRPNLCECIKKNHGGNQQPWDTPGKSSMARQIQHLTGWWLTYPSEKYESQLGWLFPIYGKIKNVPNHQPVDDFLSYKSPISGIFHVWRHQRVPISTSPPVSWSNVPYILEIHLLDS